MPSAKPSAAASTAAAAASGSNDSSGAAMGAAVASSSALSADAQRAAQQKASKERVEVVDDDNKTVRVALRADVRAHNLPHRSTYVYVMRFDPATASSSSGSSEPQYLVQKRTAIKDYCPSYLEVCAGGVMGVGETYADNVEREVHEELGLPRSSLTLIDHGVVRYRDAAIDTFGGLWTSLWSGQLTDLKLQPEEVSAIHLQTYAQVHAAVKAGAKYTPDSLHMLELQAKAYAAWKQQQQQHTASKPPAAGAAGAAGAAAQPSAK